MARAKADAALKSVQLRRRAARFLHPRRRYSRWAVGRRILPKANLVDEAAQCLRCYVGAQPPASTRRFAMVTPK